MIAVYVLSKLSRLDLMDIASGT